MAFGNLAEKLQETFKKLRGKGKISEADVKEAMREVKLALLEADVNFKVVKSFVANVSEKALGESVMQSLTPGQMIIKIVADELTELMGGANAKINFASAPPTIIMMVGLQGAGKTTTSAKLGGLLKEKGKRPLLAACDVYRPAAMDQLEIVGKQLDLPTFKVAGGKDAVAIAKQAIAHANANLFDVVIIDTAGRLHIDEQLMQELHDIKAALNVAETLLVVDAMTGQDAVNVAESFNDKLGIDGVILTKMDGDARGGAALSVRFVADKPIKFVGMGEKLGDLEPFYPDRMAQRILGMGDVLTLIDKAQKSFDEKNAAELQKRLLKNQFNLNDFLDQLEQIQNMGPISQILDMMPGMDAKKLGGASIDERKMVRVGAIIKSMTPKERESPNIINSSRKKRIALGSGTTVQDINSLLKQFAQMQTMFKQMNNTKGSKKLGKMGFPFG